MIQFRFAHHLIDHFLKIKNNYGAFQLLALKRFFEPMNLTISFDLFTSKLQYIYQFLLNPGLKCLYCSYSMQISQLIEHDF